MTYDQFEYWVAAALLVFSMIGMGAALTVADFVAVLRGPHRIVLVLVAQCVGAPLLAILVARLLPVHHAALARWCVRFSLVMLAAIVIGSIVSGRLHVAAHGWRMPLALFLLASGSLWLTYFACLLTRQSMTDAFTMGVEVLVRNGNLGLLLKASLFPAGKGPQEIGDAVLYTILLYAGISLGVAVVEVWGHRNQTGLMFGWRRRT